MYLRPAPAGGTKRRYGAGGEEMATSSLHLIDGVPAMPQPNDLSRSLVALDQNSTIIAVIEMSQSSWLVAGMLPGIERQPRQKLEPSPERLLGLLHRWRDEAVRAGRTITPIAVASGRSLLRRAPAFIVIGEIRDLETVQIAVQAALTGHLVLSTIHEFGGRH